MGKDMKMKVRKSSLTEKEQYQWQDTKLIYTLYIGKNQNEGENIPEIDLDRDLEGEIPLRAL